MKKVLAILLAILFVLSLTAVAVDGGRGGRGRGMTADFGPTPFPSYSASNGGSQVFQGTVAGFVSATSTPKGKQVNVDGKQVGVELIEGQPGGILGGTKVW